MESDKNQKVVAVVGLGYVGLPLALAFGKKLKTIGYDLSVAKVSAYKDHFDPTGEMPPRAFKDASKISYTNNPSQIKLADFVVVAVPTPVDKACRPDFSALESSSKTVGENLKPGAVVIYESTVYPGATEEICAPILEKYSGLKCGVDFKLGYSPERINPGDKEHTLEKIVKVVSAQDTTSLEQVAWLYGQVVDAGIHKASSIKVAEAAKVIENTQRDINIALMNELSIIFKRMNIDTHEVLEAAGTKWNFLKFTPGLVGGHCIGVDPYYLTHKATQLGYEPHVILSGRRINDSMGAFVAQQTIKQLEEMGRKIAGAHILVLGITFKENICDLRNSKVADVINELKKNNCEVSVWDPVAKSEEAHEEYGITLADWRKLSDFDAIIAAVPHKEVLDIDLKELAARSKPHSPFIDIKSKFEPQKIRLHGFKNWRL